LGDTGLSFTLFIRTVDHLGSPTAFKTLLHVIANVLLDLGGSLAIVALTFFKQRARS
jgi:hypothetical protein